MNRVLKTQSQFEKALEQYGVERNRKGVYTLQINLGNLCNQACNHCHVGAGPEKTDVMSRETIDMILSLLKNTHHIEIVDITGGAPELNPNFRYLVASVRQMGLGVIDRCNLTVLSEAGQEDTAQFLADYHVQVVASMPCYLEKNVDAQRGDHVYKKSIEGLKKLNALGYGKEGSGLELNLVFNPSGMGLPPAQSALENDYKAFMFENHGIFFNQLLTITNMPIKRFKERMEEIGKLQAYENLLTEKFNPEAAQRIMCKELISVSWNGRLFDCDFNQALDIPVTSGKNLWDIESFDEIDKVIVFKNHCYGCTAGSGSSCKGALI